MGVLFKNNKFLYIVTRSLIISLLIIITAYEYYQSIQGNIKGGVLFTLMLFLLIYAVYIREELEHGKGN